jgi:RNA polymerase sigma-70 factor (ECF subfamily)
MVLESEQVIQPGAPPEVAGEHMVESVAFSGVGLSGGDTDAQLMWRLRAQDESALGALYDRHAGVAFGLALRMLRDHAAAEEVVQDAFISLWKRAAAYAPDRASVRTWLLTMVRSRAIDRLRRVTAKERDSALDDGAELVAVSDTWRLASEGMRADAVRRALIELPPEQRQILEWAYFGGLSQAEIAERTGIAVGTVKSRTRLALERLRRLLADSVAAEAPEL